MNNIIGFFEYNNNKFAILLNNDNNILFLKKNKNTDGFTNNLNKEDCNVVNTVYNSLLINKKKFYIFRTNKIKSKFI